VSDEDVRKGMKDMGMDDWTINSNIELFKITRAGNVSDIYLAVRGSYPASIHAVREVFVPEGELE
jgi:hypothetical protein